MSKAQSNRSDKTKHKLSEANKGKIHIHNINYKKAKMINPVDFPEYELAGWIRGMLPECFI